MSREKTLIKNTIIYAIGNFGSRFLGFFLLPFYTIYLSTNEYGYYDMLINTVNLIVPIVTLQIYDGMYRNLLDAETEKDKKEAITNSAVIISTFTIPFIVLYIIFLQIRNFQFSYLLLFVLLFTVISNLWAQIARGLKHNVVYSVSGLLITLCTLVFNIFFIVVLKFKAEALFISSIIAYAVSIAYIEYKLKIFSYIKLNLVSKNYKRGLYRYSIPLIPNAISWWVLNVSNRYLLIYYLGEGANGIYAVANKFSSLIVMANSIFSLAWQESSITEYKSKDKDIFYTKMFKHYMIFQYTLLIILISFTKVVFPYFVKGNFASAMLYVPFLYIGSVFSAFSVFYGAGYLSAKDTMGAFYTTVLGAVLNIGMNMLLLPYIGIQGASVSAMMSYLIVWIVRVIQTRKYFNINIEKRTIAVLTIITALYTIGYYYGNTVIQIGMAVLSFIIFAFFNKDILLKAVNMVLKRL